MSNRKVLFNILRIVVSVGLLVYIFTTLDLQTFLENIRQAKPLWLVAALATMMITVVMRAYRWQILLDAIKVPVPLMKLTEIYFIGFLFNNLLPSGLGGDAMRMLELRPYAKQGSDMVTSVLVDRFLGLFALQAIAIAGLLLDWQAIPLEVVYLTLGLFIFSLIAGILLISRPIFITLRRIPLFRRVTDIKTVSQLFASFQSYPLPALGRSFLVSMLFNFTLITMNVFIGWGIGAKALIVHYVVFVPITSVVLILPISFAGLGVREGTFQTLFSQVGVPEETAVAMSLMVYVIGNICTGLIGGIIYLLRSARSLVSEKG